MLELEPKKIRRSAPGFVSIPCAIAISLLASMPVAAQAPRPMVNFGDSITAGFGDDGVDCFTPSTFDGYPRRLRQFLGSRGISVAVINEGVCGEFTGEALSRIDEIVENAGDVGLFVLMEGTNDISTLTGGGNFGVETIRANLAELARRAAEYRLEPIYASVIPRGPDAGRDSNNARTSLLRDRIADLAATEGRVFVDAFTALFETPEIFENFYFDAFHPNTPGYDLLANAFGGPALQAWSRVGAPGSGPCVPNASRVCLNQGRFEVTVDWLIAEDGRRGIGRAVSLTEDTGYFYFFRDDNIELVIKVLDAREVNGHFWVFYGALSNLDYTITVRDTETEAIRRYVNPNGTFASVGDTRAFEVASASSAARVASADSVRADSAAPSPMTMDDRAFAATSAARSGSSSLALEPTSPESTLPQPDAKVGGCVENAETLCLNDARFQIRVDWVKPNGDSGSGIALLRTPDTGMFYFFRPGNVELIVKILDGREANGHFWVFYGALSNVEYTMTVVDTATDRTRIYRNEPENFGSVGDTRAFLTPLDP